MASTIDWTALTAELNGIECISEPTQVAKLSQDYYHFSPILQPIFAEKRGDLVVKPANEAEVIQVAKTCVKYRVPLTVRGAGTGNYGQCVPLAGGVILDMTKMTAVKWVRPGVACVEPGAKLAAIDKQTRPSGWELRMVPSTYRTATIGGFIGGGSGGIGSITYGQLRDRGNLRSVKVVTMEEEPRVVELRGEAVYQVAHAYGTNGIITELEMPLAPALPWAEVIATFPSFMAAARFGQSLGDADGILKRLITICADPIPQYFTALRSCINPGTHAALMMVSEDCLEPLRELVQDCDGQVTYEKPAEDSQKGIALWEYTWNHTTLHARSVDPNLTYLQTLFPYDPNLTLVEQMYQEFGDEAMMHLEFLRVAGRTTPAALQLVRFSSPERLQAIIDRLESLGAIVFNPHAYTIEDGGMKAIDQAQLTFKQQVDPYGLLNPGKMRGWNEMQPS
ncbi:FAD-binding oxidoreductase [Alkalinema pantanalense CENA528]|uniref:FAD-binding oxidoreductase n=1 Tax=Alkalinema pantanalense TaxID=1620705 RepID=UPI003D6E616A